MEEARPSTLWARWAVALIQQAEQALMEAEERIAALQQEVAHWQREAVWRTTTALGETARAALVESNRADLLIRAIEAHRNASRITASDRDAALYAALERSAPPSQRS